MYDNRQRFEARAFLLLLAASSVLFGWLLILYWRKRKTLFDDYMRR